MAIKLKKKIHNKRASVPFEGEVELITIFDGAIDYAALGERATEVGQRFQRAPHKWPSILPMRAGIAPTRFVFEIPDLPTRRRIDVSAHSTTPSREAYDNTRAMIAFATCLRRVVGLYQEAPDAVVDCSIAVPVEVREEISAEIEILFGRQVLDMAEGRIVQEGELCEKKSPSPSSSTPEES